MKIKVQHLHSGTDLFLMSDKSFPRFEMLKTKEYIELRENEIGLLLPSTTLNQNGAVFVGGEVRPGWKGYVLIELHIWQPVVIREGDIVGHLWIFEDEEPIEFAKVE